MRTMWYSSLKIEEYKLEWDGFLFLYTKLVWGKLVLNNYSLIIIIF